MQEKKEKTQELTTIVLNKRVNFGLFKLPKGATLTGVVVRTYAVEGPKLDGSGETEVVERFDFVTADGIPLPGISNRSVEKADAEAQPKPDVSLLVEAAELLLGVARGKVAPAALNLDGISQIVEKFK